MIIPNKLKVGDTIGVLAPSGPIIEQKIEELEEARKIIEKIGFKVKYSKNLFSNLHFEVDFSKIYLYNNAKQKNMRKGTKWI